MTEVWQATEADIEEGLDIAASRYDFMDRHSAEIWARHYLESPHVCILRSANVVCCVVYEVRFWRPRDLFARVVFFAARAGAGAWEAYRVLKEQVRRARERRCAGFEAGAVTGVELGPLALRLGLDRVGMNYAGAW